jgi:hypothetical protein
LVDQVIQGFFSMTSPVIQQASRLNPQDDQRALFNRHNRHDDASGMAASDDDDGAGRSSTLTLRLVSMGVIAFVSLCGCALPAAIYYSHHARAADGSGIGAGSSKLLGGASPTERLPIFSLLKARMGVCMFVCYRLLFHLTLIDPPSFTLCSASPPASS